MTLKSSALYFEIHPSAGKPIGYIRNSYRDAGKVKHQTVSKIHGLSLARLQAMKAAFDGKPIKTDDIKIHTGREYGASAMLHDLAKDIGLDKLIYSRNDSWVRRSMAMIIGRIIYQGSKLALSNISDFSSLWEICGIEDADINVNDCYDAMDELLARQDLIQSKLAKKHLADGTVILYDITSSYFEGDMEDSKLIKYGYNRDKKRGKKQMVIALICTKDGCPVSVEVFSGNTTDCTTVKEKIAKIGEDYGISDFVFVGDRGMLTKKNIESLGDTQTITALTHGGMKNLCESGDLQLSLFDEEVGCEVMLHDEPGIRYILRKNPTRKIKENATRDALIKKTAYNLQEIAVPKRKASDKTLAARAARVFVKYKTEKYFTWDIVNGRVVFERKEDIIADEQKYDGLYVIRSNVSCELMNASQVVDAYKSLINVEQAFRNMKTVQLEIRPVYHRNDDRIRAHVFICMLAYYLLWHLNRRLAGFYKENTKKHTVFYVLEVMKARQKFDCTIGSVDLKSTMIAEPNISQQKIIDFVSPSRNVA